MDAEFIAADLCGRGGEDCVDCRPNEQDCIAGQCQDAPCSWAWCTGCCAGDQCMEGNSVEACQHGERCEVCNPAHQQCHYDQRRGCVALEGTRWDVFLYDAEIAPRKGSGAAWDAFGGLPDPVVVVRQVWTGGNLGWQSAELRDTLYPDWGGAKIAENIRLDGYNYVMISLTDVDLADHDLIGRCPSMENIFEQAPYDPAGGIVECRGQYRLDPHPDDMWDGSDPADFVLRYRIARHVD